MNKRVFRKCRSLEKVPSSLRFLVLAGAFCAFSAQAQGRIFHFKTYKKGKYDFDSGQYFAFDFDNVYVEPETFYVSTTQRIFAPYNPGSGEVALVGDRYVFPTDKGANNPYPVFSGTAYYRTPSEPVITRSEVGDAYRLVGSTDDELKASLRLRWPNKD